MEYSVKRFAIILLIGFGVAHVLGFGFAAALCAFFYLFTRMAAADIRPALKLPPLLCGLAIFTMGAAVNAVCLAFMRFAPEMPGYPLKLISWCAFGTALLLSIFFLDKRRAVFPLCLYMLLSIAVLNANHSISDVSIAIVLSMWLGALCGIFRETRLCQRIFTI